jgi:CRISPR-associated protein Cmr1
LTPAFLGGADGQAELRTAPFKSLFRRWWRITNGKLSTQAMWEKEAKLFGSASGEKNNASKLRMRIVDATNISYSSEKIDLGKLTTPRGGMDAALYIGYGAIDQHSLVPRKYIHAGSKFLFELSMPKDEKDQFIYILQLIHNFGSIGSRSRNGWGSLSIKIEDKTQGAIAPIQSNAISWNNESEKYYPHFIGKDEKGLLAWKTTEKNKDFKFLFSTLATIYKELRGNRELSSNERRILGFADNNDRLPSQILLKIYQEQDNLSGRIIHIPYKIENAPKNEIDIWQKVHTFLDKETKLQRLGDVRK